MANPRTCRHDVVGATITLCLELEVECLSCGTDLTDPATRARKNYVFDTDYNVWVHQKKPKDGELPFS